MKKSNHLSLAIFFVFILVIAILIKYFGAQYLKFALIPILITVIVFAAKHILKSDAWNEYNFMEYKRSMNFEFDDRLDYFEDQEEEEEEQ